MQRFVLDELKVWSRAEQRLPLLLRVARQVGKTFLIEQLGGTEFTQFVNINFELEPEYCDCFQSLKPEDIINNIQTFRRQKITPGNTLLFLDEIQNCPRAIMALRYFKEQLPELHIIGAGSLLEFALNDENFTMPVGRVQFIYLKPLSFQEFSKAQGFSGLLASIKNCTLNKPIEKVFHQKLLNLTHEYLVTGGMPAAVQAYLETRDFLQTQRMQTVIMSTYRNDFGKYAKLTQHKYLQKIFSQIPAFIGQQIKFSKIDPEMRSRDLKQAIDLLTFAGVIQPVFATAASGLPLSATINEKKFKLLFLDVGLTNRNTGIAVNELLDKNILLLNQGAMVEQLVGQELLAYQDCYDEAKLFYWCRDVKGSTAEVDYVLNFNSKNCAHRSKIWKMARLKSLQLMLKRKKS